MSADPVNDFAQRVKKFYYHRAFFCEQLEAKAIDFKAAPLAMPPDTYSPLDNFYVDTHTLACAVIDGLSSIWKRLENPPGVGSGNAERFISFLLRLNISDDLPRVATPLICHFLDEQGIERPFSEEVRRRWVARENEHLSHQVYSDPYVDDLKRVYDGCRVSSPLPANQTIKRVNETLAKFTYAALIYKFYRNSFVHEFRASKYVSGFARGEEMAVREFSGLTVITATPDREVVSSERSFVDGITPQLDIGLGILTKAIRLGADLVSDLIITTRSTEIPYGEGDGISIATN